MIYLGEQLYALSEYSKEATCWLGLKIKGRLTSTNLSGYYCGDTTCTYCTGNGKKRSGLDQDFTDLFTTAIIKEIISAKPPRLFDIYKDLLVQYLRIGGKSEFLFSKNGQKIFIESGYANWFLKEKKNYWLAKLIDQHTCTYCNREYIFVYKNNSGGKGMVPQFDHWFSKTDYPILGLSFYNLVPSCGTCNTIKSSTPFNLANHLHPYIDRHISSSYSFSFLPTAINTNKIIFKNNYPFNQKGLDTVNALNLPLIYEGHFNKELQDLIDLRYKYSENYLNILLEKTFSNLNMSENERFRLIFGIELDVENYHKRIFSKFKNDIIEQLKNIK